MSFGEALVGKKGVKGGLGLFCSFFFFSELSLPSKFWKMYWVDSASIPTNLLNINARQSKA